MVFVKKLFVNLTTATRPPLSSCGCWYAWQEQWLEALLFSLAATLSDVADGYLAKKLDAKTRLGYKFDKACDLFMVVALSAGLKNHLAWYLYLVFPGLHLVFWVTIYCLPEQDRFRRICRVMSFFHSIGLMLALNVIFAFFAFGYDLDWILPAIVISLTLAIFKKDRLISGYNGFG